MDLFSEEVFTQLQEQAAGWSSDFCCSHYFATLSKKQQVWADLIITAFCEMMYIHHGRLPAKWTAKSLEECCCQTMPNKISINAEFFHAVSPVLAMFFDHQQDAKQIRNGAALKKAVLRVAKKIVDNADNPASWGIAKSVLSSATNHDFDPTNDEHQEFINNIHEGKLGDIEFSGQLRKELGNLDLDDIAQMGDLLPDETIIRFADTIAQELSQGKKPTLTDEMQEFIQEHPETVIVTFVMIQELEEENAEENRWLIRALLAIFELQLEILGYEIELGYDWAIEIISTLQSEIIDLLDANKISAQSIEAILTAMHSAKLESSPELLATHHEIFERCSPNYATPTKEEFNQIIDEFVKEHGENPFSIAEGITKTISYMPDDGQQFLIGEFCNSGIAEIIDAIALLTLHAKHSIRDYALQWLVSHPKTITSTTLRRLIAIRNWLPQKEKKLLDKVIRSARKSGVECAQWADGENIENLHASQIDGIGAQTVIISTRGKSGFRFSVVLIKQSVGIADVMATPLISKRKVNALISDLGAKVEHHPISLNYLEKVINHGIAVGLATGTPPPAYLLQVAEALAATGWHAQQIDFPKLMDDIITDVTRGTLQLDLEESIVESSKLWGELPNITDSWFVESQDLVDFFEKTHIKKQQQLVSTVLEEHIEPQRETWAEILALTAFWFHEQPLKKNKKSKLLNHNFAVVAKALFTGQPARQIPLMEAIAQRTIDVMHS